MGTPVNRMRILDDEKIFNLYYRQMGPAGSANKIQRYLTTIGIYNRVLNKPITTAAIWQAIHKYIARNWRNPDIKNTINKYYIDCGVDPLSDEEWLYKVSKSAKTCFGRKQYRNFLKKNPDLPDLS